MGSGRKAYLEERIRLAQGSVERLEMELQKEIEQEKQFKKLQKAKDGDVICWQQKFSGSFAYTFVALKMNGYWYTTKMTQTRRMTFTELVDQHLQFAEEGVILRVTDWKSAL